MWIRKLDDLKAWQLVLVLLALGVVAAISVWGLVWVMWTIRPLLAAAASFAAVAWALVALHRYRRNREWKRQDWIGS